MMSLDDDIQEKLIPAAVQVPEVQPVAFEDEDPGSEYWARATDLNKLFTVNEQFLHIPEARELTWTDDSFEDDAGIVAVFDLDYDAMEAFYTSIGWAQIGLSILCPPVFLIGLATLSPCYLRKNVQWAVRAKHVAITRDGIKVVEEKRSSGWGLACMDVGKKSKTVPFDKITDCDVMEPAGNECICIPRILFQVTIDTANSGQGQHELTLTGLKNPHGFKNLVWAMKREAQYGNISRNDRTSMTTSELSSNGKESITEILREIRDELRQNNEALRAIQASTDKSPT